MIGDNDPGMCTANIEVDEELIGILRKLNQPVDKTATEFDRSGTLPLGQNLQRTGSRNPPNVSDRSDAYPPADRERAAQIAASTDRVRMGVLPAGHWVHIDDPEGLLHTLFAKLGADGGG